MNVLNLPKQEDVQEFELGNQSIKVVVLTDENRPAVLEAVMQTYLDDECMYCHNKFTEAQLKTAIWAYPNEFGRIVHAECWKANT